MRNETKSGRMRKRRKIIEWRDRNYEERKGD